MYAADHFTVLEAGLATLAFGGYKAAPELRLSGNYPAQPEGGYPGNLPNLQVTTCTRKAASWVQYEAHYASAEPLINPSPSRQTMAKHVNHHRP